MMDFSKIDKTFADFIINLIGPKRERDKERVEKYQIVKSIIANTIQKEFPHYKAHVFTYGSFAMKTYMENGDIDITLILEEIKTHSLILNPSNKQISLIFLSIKKAFEEYNNTHLSDLFTDINIIYAEVQLLKCKFSDLMLDISINNLSGIAKILFFSYIEKIFSGRINSSFFRRTLLLIKAWAIYEGMLIGANVGLMASYALEVLIIYIFNSSSHLFTSEVQAFFTFFNVLGEMDWENEMLQIYGNIKIKTYQQRYSQIKDLEPFWYLDYETVKDYPFALDFLEMTRFVKQIRKILGEEQKGNKIFLFRNINIIDPLSSNNNIGKTINTHNFYKLKHIIKLVNKQVDRIIDIKNKNDPLLYMDALLKLFPKTLCNNFVSSFAESLKVPKITIKVKDDYKDKNKDKGKNVYECQLEIIDIEKFYRQFPKPLNQNENKNNDLNQYDYLIINKEILEKIIEIQTDSNISFGNSIQFDFEKEVIDFFKKCGLFK